MSLLVWNLGNILILGQSQENALNWIWHQTYLCWSNSYNVNFERPAEQSDSACCVDDGYMRKGK
jgi:hypothetical protein